MTVFSFALLDSILINSANTYIIPYVIAGLIGPSGQWGGEMWKMTKKTRTSFPYQMVGGIRTCSLSKKKTTKSKMKLVVCMFVWTTNHSAKYIPHWEI